MGVAPIHQRMAELWVKNQKVGLDENEMMELNQCLAANVKLCWEMAYLENMSLMASMTNDVDWQHEICLEIDKLEKKIARRKPPGKKK